MYCYQALSYKYSEMLGFSMYRDKKLKNVEVLSYIALLANVGISLCIEKYHEKSWSFCLYSKEIIGKYWCF